MINCIEKLNFLEVDITNSFNLFTIDCIAKLNLLDLANVISVVKRDDEV